MQKKNKKQNKSKKTKQNTSTGDLGHCGAILEIWTFDLQKPHYYIWVNYAVYKYLTLYNLKCLPFLKTKRTFNYT